MNSYSGNIHKNCLLQFNTVEIRYFSEGLQGYI